LPLCSLGFFIDVILPAVLWPWGSTQPLSGTSATGISREGGKGGRCVWLTTLPHSCADRLEILGASTS
jgi:hypothetical protein